jgi:hypothetical protein
MNMTKEPRTIDLGTVGEFEMLGLTLPGLDPGPQDEHAHILIPVSVATRLALRLMDSWNFDAATQARLLGVTPRTWARYRHGHTPTRDAHIDPIEDLLNIHKALTVLFREPANQQDWMSKPNQRFDGRTAREVLLQDGTRTVRHYLEGQVFS